MDTARENVNYRASMMSSDWEVNINNLTNTSVGSIPMGNQTVESSSSAPMVGTSFCPPIWDHSMGRPSLGYSHFPSDSGFIERAARFSCFGDGSLVEMMNPFNITEDLNPYSLGLRSIQGQAMAEMQLPIDEMDSTRVCKVDFRNDEKSENFPSNESDEAGFSGHCIQEESPSKGFGWKKRKRVAQSNENNEAPQPSIDTIKGNAEIQQTVDQKDTPTSKNGAKNVKQGSQGSDAPKEEYIHIRARRGQATNSHSLAERVRRERISERMKFLQDLVPGCSKVTGKAVMLDEIINYVQSLQRQVEFLSMKLATVNPRIDFDIEGLLTKDILQCRAGTSSSLAFPSDMTMPFPPLHASSQPGLVEACLANNSSGIIRRPISLQSISVSGGFKEYTSQVPSVWDDELHNIVHMGFNSSVPPNSQDLSSLPSGHLKAEP
ncbi:hypothetical protein OROGR_014892 [Orobanche gracilis]